MKQEQKNVYKIKSEVFKALAHPVRVAILDLLINGEKTVEQISKDLSEKQSNISKHLSILKQAGIADNKKVGLNRFYFLKYPCVVKFSICVNETIKQELKQKKDLIKLFK